MADSTPTAEFHEQSYLTADMSEDELDWQENQRRTAEDARRVDGAFVSGWLGVTGMWIVVALIGSGAFGAIRVIAALSHH